MEHPYYLVTITSLCLLFYLASIVMVRAGGYSREFHIRLWNSILLLAVLSTGITGVTLAIQVNLKLDMPLAGKLLSWHVNFGIGLLIVSVLHLLRHYKHYLNMVRLNPANSLKAHDAISEDEIEIPAELPPVTRVLLPASLGITAMAAQIILLREFLSLFHGNELVIGILFANWMLLTGIGAWLGKAVAKKERLETLLISLLVLPILVPVTLFSADYLRNLVFAAGSMISLSGIILSTLVLLAPFCLFSGFLFTRLTSLLAKEWGNDTPSKVYALESLGSVIGGALILFVLVFYLRPFESTLAVLFINVLLLAFVAIRAKKRGFVALSFSVFFLLMFLVIGFDPDMLTRKYLFPRQEIEYYKDTPYGSLVVTQTGGQRNGFVNSTLLFTSQDVISNEEAVHYAMLQRPDPGSVLMVEGGALGIIGEILKYPVRKVSYLEINPWILKLAKEYNPGLSDRRVSVHRVDIRKYLDTDTCSYDVILLNVAEPSTLLNNRYYTLEFFRSLKSRMREDAVCSLGLMPTPNYVGGEAGEVHSSVMKTLKEVFSYVDIIPGGKNYFLASDIPLNTGIVSLVSQRRIATEYVNEFYLDDELLQQRSAGIRNALSGDAEINRDFKPVVFSGQLQYWLSYFNPGFQFALLAILALVALWALRIHPLRTGIMVTGFTASSLEILLLFIYQVLFGNLYLMAGFMILVFMGGLYAGARSESFLIKTPSFRHVIRIQLTIAMACLVILLSVMLIQSRAIPTLIVQIWLTILLFSVAILGGVQYSCTSRVLSGSVVERSGSLYSSDLLGSAAGCIAIGIWIVPSFGIETSLGMILLLNLFAAAWLFFRRRKVISL